MLVSFEVWFDEISNKKIRNYWSLLSKHGVSDFMEKMVVFPHITLSVYREQISIKKIETFRKIAARVSSENINLNSIGTFGKSNVIFLRPSDSSYLRTIKMEIEGKIIGKRLDLYNEPDWVPHCTLAMNVPETKFSAGFQLIRKRFKPFEVRIRELVVVECDPLKVIERIKL
ncbi:MAG: 2'-5' RNA ligase family protein [Fibrobacteria bacterium]